jgi:hypothetical protein
MDGGLVLTEFGAMEILKEMPFTLLNQYMKLFDHYSIRKSDLLLLLKSLDEQASLIKTTTSSKNVDFSGAMNPETGALTYDEWYGKDYDISIKEFDNNITVIKERVKASYEANKIRTKNFWIPVSISILSLLISIIVNLQDVFSS